MALLSGVAAKEIVVSTLGVLYTEEPPYGGAGREMAEMQGATDSSQGENAEAAAIGMPETDTAAGKTDAGDTAARTLSERIAASGDFSTAAAMAFLVFILLYFPCLATVAAIGAEAGWRWAAAAVAYDTLLAWLAAWGVYNLLQLF